MKRLMYNVIITLLLSSTIIISCKEESEIDHYSVKGYIVCNNKPAENVNVSIDDKYNFTAISDAKGYFIIDGIPAGDHKLKMKKTENSQLKSTKNDSSTFVEKTIDLSIYKNIELENLRLPKATYIHEAKNITEFSALISWSPTDDAEFREYKLYRHNTTGLDESTGTLVHVSTSINDTTFTDSTLMFYENYCYRVYIMDNFGRIGGSKIIQFKTKNGIIIKNGGFEESSNEKPSNWTLIENNVVYTKSTAGNPDNYIKIDPNNSTEGNNSLQFHHATEGGCWEMWITQQLNSKMLVPGSTYKFSLNYKSDFSGNGGMTYLGLRNSAVDKMIYLNYEFTNDGLWKNLSYEFSMPDIGSEDLNLTIHFCNQGINNWWLDDIKLEKK